MISNQQQPAAAIEAAPLTPLKRAFLALEDAQSRLAVMERSAHEPIAVIGLGCRTPGGGVDAASFWQLMRDGIDAVGPIPADRWDAEALFDPDPAAVGRIATRAGGFLGSVDGFDPAFFGISPREAQGMDPQQRLLLEVCWEALEHAGQAPDRLERSATGVYVGMCSSDYAYLQLKTEDVALLDAHFTSGIAHSIVSGRISYLLGLQGPSLTIDTACSSSLVAVHLACQSLRSGDCRMALAGGVNLILSPDLYIALSHSRMLAPDGRCKTFDAEADGFARAEGCGVVVLKRLHDAQADGDRILAVIAGSAVNQDGPSSSMTAPNGPAQEAVIRAALARAGLAPRDVGYIEAHGTGTQLGDPLEVHALGAVFGADRDPGRPLMLGSVKTNIGHMEAAAGVTGLIKLVLALHHRKIPPHLHFHQPSPHIAWRDLPLQVPTALTEWEPLNGRRVGGVSSFGFSGTNAHVVVQEAPVASSPPPEAAAQQLFALSAASEDALIALAGRYAAWVQGRPDAELADICFTAGAGRAHHAQRATIIAATVEELHAGLVALAAGSQAVNVRTEHVAPGDPPRIAFLFTGQGAQYAGMARHLYRTAPIFKAALDRCAELLAPMLPKPLLEVLFTESSDASLLDETALTQPALFAVGYALTELWRAWGIAPNAVIGHSVGEYGAACAAGVLSVEDGLRLVAARGRLMQSLPAGGAMAAIYATQPRVLQAVADRSASVSIAAVNGAEQTVISGPAADVEAVCQEFINAGVRCQTLPVSHAFHSPLMESILDSFEAEVATASLLPPRLRLISNLTGKVAGAEEVTTTTYWRRHVRETVRFSEGLATLAALKPDCCIEIGPHPTLLSFAGSLFGEQARLIPSLRKGRQDREQMLDSLASLYLAGVEVDWRGVFPPQRHRIVDLPSYPFQRERYWFVAAPKATTSMPRGRNTGHPLLGVRLLNAGAQTIYESSIGADSPGFLRQHRVLGHVIVPATAYLDTLLAAASERLGSNAVQVEQVTIREALFLEDSGALQTLQVVCDPVANGAVTVSLSSLGSRGGDAAFSAREAEAWTTHATAVFRAGHGPDTGSASSAAADSLAQARASCSEALSVAEHYAAFERLGLEFGADFRSISRLQGGEAQALGEVMLSDALRPDAGAYRLHPVLLDGCLQVLAAALRTDGVEVLYLPIGIGRYRLQRPGMDRCWSHVRIRPGAGDLRQADIRVYDLDGGLVAELQDVQLKRVSRDAFSRLDQRWLDDCCYETRWQSAPAGACGLATQVLAAAGAAAVADLRERAGIDAYDRFLPRFESLCAGYVARALRRLGWSPMPGETVQVDELARRLQVAPAHRRLFSRLLGVLGEAGKLRRAGAGWLVVETLDFVDLDAQVGVLKNACPGAAAELELTARVAGELAEALRGERDPMQLLFPGGSLATAERLYRDAPTALFFNGLLAEVVAAAAGAASREGRRLRILEIGGGTGGSTAHVLPRLEVLPAGSVEYTFTDVGPLFVAKARTRFGNHSFMRFEVLDLERDGEEQGLARQGFDLVIAANVVHATVDLRQSLRRVAQLMAPGGLLAMLEVTAPQPWFDLTVGLTPGWWAFRDHDLRPDYATLSRDDWLSLLPTCGLEDATALPAGSAHGALALQSLLLAKSAAPLFADLAEPASARRVAAVAAGRRWLLFADREGIAVALADRLRSRGDHCTLVTAGSIYDFRPDAAVIDGEAPEHYARLLVDLERSAGAVAGGGDLHGVVHAWSLDSPGWEALSSEELAHCTRRGAISAMLAAQALARHGGDKASPRLWIISRGAQPADPDDRALSPQQAAVWGLAKTVSLEHPELECVCIDLDSDAMPGNPTADAALALAAELDEPGVETQVALRRGSRWVARLTRVPRLERVADPVAPSGSWGLAAAVPGALEGLGQQPRQRRLPGPRDVEIEVQATSLNFKDVLNVLGMYPGDAGPLGGECAGRVTAVGIDVTHVRVGDDVLAVAGGSFASHVVAGAELVQPRPAGLDAEEAAAFPIAFLTAEFCLGHLAGMKAGDRVLIHAAAGGVGMAAVRLAQRSGAEIFATAGSASKREVLRAMGVSQVFDSRTPAFAHEIRALTAGRGVDVILNSLSGEMIEASFDAIAVDGRFIEIGKRGIKDAAWVEALGKGVRYHVVDWGATAAQQPRLVGDMLARLVDEVRGGLLAPLPRHVFGLQEVERAFRFMAQARHIGKIVVRHGPPTPVKVRGDGTYLVTGGLSGIGPEFARWLAAGGAGRIVLIGRRGVTAQSRELLEELRQGGFNVLVQALDVTDEKSLASLLERLRVDGPPLRGVIHGAGVLDDAGLTQQDAARFERVFGPKVHGGYLLDKLTRCDPLDFFVLLSSAASVLGSPGQANHSAANAFLDLLAHERRSRGLHGLSINWGPWSEVGAAAGRGITERLAAQGLRAVTPSQGLAALERLMQRQRAQVAVLPIDWRRYEQHLGSGALPAFLSGVRELAEAEAATAPQVRPQVAVPQDIGKRLQDAPPARRRSLLAAFVGERALRALGIDPSRVVDPRMPLGDMGLDSLLAVELRNTLGAAIGRPLPATLLFDYPTLDTLVDYLLDEVFMMKEEGLQMQSVEVAAPSRAARGGLVDSVEDLSDEEVDRQLAARAAGSAR